MEIILVTDQKQLPSPFRDMKGKNGPTLSVIAPPQLKKNLDALPVGAVVYLDASSYRGKGLYAAIKAVLESGRIPGICDVKGTVDDPSFLFFEGAVDYIGKSAAAVKITPARIGKVREFAERINSGGSKPAPVGTASVPDAVCWDDIEEGKDYPFCMMYIELDHLKEMKRRVEADKVDRIVQSFHDYLRRIIGSLDGRIWMWGDSGGVVLFPREETRNDVIVAAYRLVLYRRMISVEDFNLGFPLCFRIVIHVGETTYQCRGETGTIISDSINSLFHLGNRFASPGNFYVTEEAEPHIPIEMRQAFLPAGKFEGRKVVRMRLPLWDMEPVQ